MNLRYTLGSIIAIPLLPFMYYQGKRIRATTPELPEAKDLKGFAKCDTEHSLRILYLGESTMAGVGVESHEKGFAGTFAKLMAQELQSNIEWRVYAKSGYTAQRVHNEILTDIEEKSANLIIVGLGGNDAFFLTHPAKWKASIRQLIRSIRAKFGNVPIGFLNMPAFKSFPAFTPLLKFTVGNLGEILGEELGKVVAGIDQVYYSPEVITTKAWTKKWAQYTTDESSYFSDGVHPSELTYQVWARDFFQFLERETDVLEQLKNFKPPQ